MALLNETQMFARMAVMRGPVVDTSHDFTAMTPAEVDEAYPLSIYASAQYCVQVDGTYVDRADVAPVTDKGLWCDGAFTNYAVNGLLSGAVAGSPGTMPTLWTFDPAGATQSSVAISTHKGLPLLTVVAAADASERQYLPNQYLIVGGTEGQVLTFSAFSAAETTAVWAAGHPHMLACARNGWDGSGKIAITATIAYHKMAPYTVPSGQVGSFYNAGGGYITSAGGGAITCKVAAPQFCIDVKLSPNTLALSSGSTTAKPATIIQREVDLRGPFAVEINATTAPGDPGAHQTIWCGSLGANDYIHVYRATSTDQVTLKVRANSTDYSVACGVVADDTDFTLRFAVEFNRVRWSLNESAAASLTIKRSASYILESLGTFYDGTLPAWGSVQSVKIAAGKIATDEELEEGWA